MKEQASRMNVPIRNAMMGLAVNFICLLAILPLTPLLKAQSFYGSIVGTATDSSGAVVPGATVTVTNLGTHESVKVRSDAGGKYSVQDLIPANYMVEVEKSNFKKTERTSVIVEVGAVVRIDVTLAVGNTTETVEVTTATPLLQTDTSSLNQEVEGDVVQQMPLNGRNVMNLIALAPGVIATGSSEGSTGLNQATGKTTGGIGFNNYEIGGAIQAWSTEYIDGAPDMAYGGNPVILVPTQDAVQEFSVLSSDATADFGRYAGGVVSMTTKSGSNAFHGSVYEYLRNADFNANSYFNNLNDIPKAAWNQNQYGAGVNGPIKRDKAFFMFTWEGFGLLEGATNTEIVPTLAMQNGVIPEVYSSTGTLENNNVTDPLGNCIITHQAGTASAPGTWTITNLYQAGKYGGTCGDPVSEVVKQFWPLPNTNGVGYNWLLNAPLTNKQNQYNGRVDYQITPKQRLFGRYSWWHVVDGNNSIFGDIGSPATASNPTSGKIIGTAPTTWPTAAGANADGAWQIVIGNTYALNPTTVLDIRASYSRVTSTSTQLDSNENESIFDQYQPGSFKPYTALEPGMLKSMHMLPEVAPTGDHGLYTFGSLSNFAVNYYNSYTLGASLVKILGSHTLKAGFEARLMDNSGTPNSSGYNGYYTYSPTFGGDEWASFLMGYPEGSKAAYFQNIQYTAAYSYYQGYYVMDDWQASHKLTVNLGLRYELPGAPAERNNKLAVLLPHAVDPYTGITGTEGLVGGPLYSPRTAIVEQYNLFAPRVGFAYRATNNTVLHAGYGIAYLPNDLSGSDGVGTLPFLSAINAAQTTAPAPSSATPLSQTVTTSTGAVGSILGCMVNGPTASGCSGYAQAGIVQPEFTPQANFMTLLGLGSSTSYKGQVLNAPVPNQSYPYTQQWNLALSHQFKGDWMMQVSYAGLKGTNLPQIGDPPHTYFSIDALHSQYYSIGDTVLSSKIGSAAASAAGYATCPNATGLGGQITVGQCLRPNPYYSDMQDTARWTAHQNYKSMQITTQKRLGSNGVINANYAWAKNMSNTDSANQQFENTYAPRNGDGEAGLQDYNNLGNEYSLIAYDVTNRFLVDYEVNLPFGKGQKYANSLGDLGNALASGWAINGITTFQSGFPVFIYSSANNFLESSLAGSGQLRPNVVPGCNKKISGGSATRVRAGAWFNTACFAQATSSNDGSVAGSMTLGDEPRVDPDLRADAIKNFDFAFQKSTPMGFESSSFVFRAEFFNIMNRVQFNPPVDTYGTSNFGNVITQRNNPRQIQLSARINF